MSRTLADRLELVDPRLTRVLLRGTLRLPRGLRVRILEDAFDRARDAFNRGDLDVVYAAFSPEIEYHPPPPLPGAHQIRGIEGVRAFWEGVVEHYDENRIENLEVIEAGRGRIRRRARLRHAVRASGETLEYEILQTTEIRDSGVVRQVNALSTPSAPGAQVAR